MKVLGHLYKMMYDAVQDAEMLVDYAVDAIKDEKTAEYGKYFAANAANRLTKDYKEAKTYLEAIIAKEELADNIIATIALEKLDTWKDNIIHRIEKL